MYFLLNIPSESCQVKRAKLIFTPLSEPRSLLSQNPQVCGLLLRGLTTQVDHSQTILRHRVDRVGRGEHGNSLNLQVVRWAENQIVRGSSWNKLVEL